MRAGHYFTEFYDFKLGQEGPLGFCIFTVTAYYLLIMMIPRETQKRWGFGMYKVMIEVAEEFPKFKDALPEHYLYKI